MFSNFEYVLPRPNEDALSIDDGSASNNMASTATVKSPFNFTDSRTQNPVWFMREFKDYARTC